MIRRVGGKQTETSTVQDLQAVSNPSPVKSKKAVTSAAPAESSSAPAEGAIKKKGGSSYSARRKQQAAKKKADPVAQVTQTTAPAADEMVDVTTVEEPAESQAPAPSAVGLAEALVLKGVPPQAAVSYAPHSITRTPLSLTEEAVGDQTKESEGVRRLKQELANMKNQIARYIFGQSDESQAPAPADDPAPTPAPETTPTPSTSANNFSGPPPPPPPPPPGFVVPRASKLEEGEKPANRTITALKKGEPPAMPRSSSFNVNDLEGGSRKLKKTNRL